METNLNTNVNRTEMKLTVSRKNAKILTVYRKRHHPIKTLLKITKNFRMWVLSPRPMTVHKKFVLKQQ